VAAVRSGPEAEAGREREALPGLAAAGLLRGMDVSGTPPGPLDELFILYIKIKI
jgi:hypothetical protein